MEGFMSLKIPKLKLLTEIFDKKSKKFFKINKPFEFF